MELEGGQDLDREVEEELRHCNKRLLQENSKLQTQLDAQDDTLAALTHDKGCLEDKIRRLQDVTDLQSEVSTENEDLKCLLSHCQEESKGLLNRILQLERDNTGLQVQLHDAEQKCYKLTSDGEAVNNAIKELRRTVSEQKIALQEADSAQKSLEMELAEREQILADVKSSLGELSKINKELKKNNEELQLHLAQTQQQLARHSLQPQQSLVKRTLSSLDGNESDDENSDDDDDDDHIRSLPFAVTELSSVPMESFSIHTEIKDMLEESQNVPCPLSGKEQQETLTSDDELLTTAVVDMDIADFLEHLPDITLDAFMAVLTKKYHPQGWRSTTVVARSEDRLLAAQVGCTKEQAETPEDEETSVSNAEANGASSGTCYTQGSDSINERLKQFLQKVKDLKEENQRLQSVHQAAVDSVVDMEGDVLSRVTSADTRIMVLRDILQEERTQKSRLQGQVVTLKKILGIVHKKDNLEFDTVRDTLCRQQDKIEHLKRSNLELAEKYHKAELKITDLQEEAHEATLQLEREKHRCSKLEEAVSSSTLARQLDLREIWRLVQKDVESEFLTTQDGSELSSSSEEIKERILQEIKARDSSRLSRMGMGEGSMVSMCMVRAQVSLFGIVLVGFVND
ncbi:uncharacterized protein LOC143298288 [Babylonia areolata]|uniref:uncharacterized protein LOC143298288 n=1 Tax=Babylonia areolata TaxID=304850 RepID=UPI003FD09DDC